jgi:hypothetical protein
MPMPMPMLDHLVCGGVSSNTLNALWMAPRLDFAEP